MMKKKRPPHDGASGRQFGRPKKGEPPRVPYAELDKLLVHGEVVPVEGGEGTTVYFPSYRELGVKYGVSNSVIAKYSKYHNCLHRREEAQMRTRAKVDREIVDRRARAIAATREDALIGTDAYILSFKQAVAEGRVRCDNPSDFNTMVRLKAFIEGGADSRSEVHAGLSLEMIQERHRKMLKALEESTPAERGEVVRDGPARKALPVGDPALMSHPPASPFETTVEKAPGYFSGEASEEAADDR